MSTRKPKHPGAAPRPGQPAPAGGPRELRPRYSQLAQGDGCASDEALLAAAGPMDVEPGTLAEVPAGAVLGTGCSYPLGDVDVPEGAVVLDLGCGGGTDCFQAGRRVQDDGLLIGEDLTEVALERTRIAARASAYSTAKFNRAAGDALPVADASVDLVISNCVLNLVSDKTRAYAEIHRVLRPGGRAAIGDVVTRGSLSPEVRRDIQAYIGCVVRALDREDYLRLVRAAGFREVLITRTQEFAFGASEEGAAQSITVVATK
ncbi:MAG TPA: methyltransferase domain-containing protein [Candidatus Saccharimonadales bacterium]|nr:methyltransferase domain-containing protein [Candidatus Saccharimonadales bacterium]